MGSVLGFNEEAKIPLALINSPRDKINNYGNDVDKIYINNPPLVCRLVTMTSLSPPLPAGLPSHDGRRRAPSCLMMRINYFL